MNRIFCLILVVCLLFGVVSCSDNADIISSDTETEADSQEMPTQNDNGSSKTGNDTLDLPEELITLPGSFERAVLIVADGAGSFFKDTPTPNMDRIFANGAVTHKCKVVFPSSSRENFAAMLLGVDPAVHNLSTVALNIPWPSDSKFPSIFRVIRENDEDADLASILNWNFMNTNIIENDLGVYKVQNSSDAGVTNKVCEYLETSTPKMLFVQFNEPDVVGHYEGGFGSQEQFNNITEIDYYIGNIYDAYEKKGIADDTLFIVTADHGGIDNTHGGDTDGEKYVTFAVAGKGVNNGEIQDMDLRDTAAIIMYALGYECPYTWTSRVPTGVFNRVTAIPRPIYRDKDSARYHKNEPTPTEGSKGYITNFIMDHMLRTYLTFDGDIGDSCGEDNTAQFGEIEFTEGYYGEAANLDHGYVSIKNYAPGNSSFTLSMWMDLRLSSESCIVSNKNSLNGTNSGYALSVDTFNRYINLNLGDGVNQVNLRYNLPSNFGEGWMHILIVVDMENNKIGLSCDFGTLVMVDIPTNMHNLSFVAFPHLNIGQDGAAKLGPNGIGGYYRKLHATIDEFMIFDGVFDQSDVNALSSYYGKML